MDGFIGRLGALFDFEGDTLGAALVVLAIDSTIGLAGRMARAGWL